MVMRKEVIDKFEVLITSAFGLVAALAWNSAIQELVKNLFGTQSTIKAMFVYAIIVTIIAVYLTLWISNLSNLAKRKREEREARKKKK